VKFEIKCVANLKNWLELGSMDDTVDLFSFKKNIKNKIRRRMLTHILTYTF